MEHIIGEGKGEEEKEGAVNVLFPQLINATNSILPQLQELELSNLTKLKHVFKNGAQARLGFQNLQILDVRSCDNMEHVIGEGEGEEENEGAVNVLFSQLVKLLLLKLRNLVSFFSGNRYTLPWSSMQELRLENCPNMKTISSGIVNEDRGITSHDYLFNKHVSLVKLHQLHINNIGCEIIWHFKTQVSVEDMKVSGCRKLKNVLASSCGGIKSVVSLSVFECDSLGEVFQFECERGADATLLIGNGVRKLTLRSLLKLNRICNISSRDLDHLPDIVTIEAALTRNLTSLCLVHCPSLYRVFSLSDTTGSVVFPKLNQLKIENCLKMKEVFGNDKATTSSSVNITTLLPNLGCLRLQDNANLKSIVRGMEADDATEFSLEYITISGCPKLEPSSFYFSLLNNSKLKTSAVAFENPEVSVNTWTKQMLIGVDNLMDMPILDGKSTPPPYFSDIKSVKLQNLLTFPGAAWRHFLQSLPNLVKLGISSCVSVEVIFGLDQGLNPQKLPQLTELKLTCLNNLKCIWMKNMPIILSQRFQNLVDLHVGECHSLRNVLTPSVAKHLQNLKSLTVENCSMVEEICAAECKVVEEIGVQGDEIEEISTQTIEFLRVNSLTLKNIPNLVSFCTSQGYIFNWPALQEVVIIGCPKLKLFALAIASTPMLKEVETECQKYPSIEDLDAAIQQISKEKVAGSDIGKAECSESSGSCFRILPSHDWTKQLQNLRFLKVASCHNMEVLFDLSQVNNATNTILPQLEELDLHDLPMLKQVWKNGAPACRGFQSLKILQVSNCESMEHIDGKGEEENEGGVAAVNVLFPRLEKLTLRYLPKLNHIRKNLSLLKLEDNAVEFSLEKIIISGCPKLEPSSFCLYLSLLDHSELKNTDIEIELKNTDIEIENQKASVSTYRKQMLIDGVDNLMDMLILDGKSVRPPCFSYIRSVYLLNLLNLPGATLFYFLQSLPNLEKLCMSSCGSIEVVFGLDQGLNPEELPQLTKLRLTRLEKLTCIWAKDIPIILSQRFQNLRKLHVWECHNLRNLLALSMVKHLPSLTILTIELCNMVEEICVAECKVVEDEGVEISNEAIEFPRVEKLTLGNLPNLTSFCASQVYAFNWPSLAEVIVTNCPKLETFTLAVSNTPKLEEVKTHQSKKQPLMEDLNATIQLIFKEKGSKIGIIDEECESSTGRRILK